jgi:hypothetical protein
MEIKKVIKYGNSKIIRVNNYNINDEMIILSLEEYHNLIKQIEIIWK